MTPDAEQMPNLWRRWLSVLRGGYISWQGIRFLYVNAYPSSLFLSLISAAFFIANAK